MSEKEQLINQENQERMRGLIDRVDRAMADCLSADEQETIAGAEDDLMSRFIRGEISLQEYCRDNDEISQEVPGEVVVDSFDDCYVLLMGIFKDRDFVLGLINHERSHAEEAEEGGIKPELIIRFSRMDSGKACFNLAIKLGIPEDGDEELIRKTLISIIGAPDQLSGSDEKKLAGRL